MAEADKPAALTRAAILGAAPDLRRELVDVPEWGGAIWVREMTGAELDRYEGQLVRLRNADKDGVADRNVRALLVVFTACDEDGELLFAADDIEALGARSGAVLDRIYGRAEKLNRRGIADLQELMENFVNARTGASTSA